MLLCCYMLCGAQATSLVVENQTPGWLSSKISYGDQQTVENLTLSGYLNLDDLKFIGSLINSHNLNGFLDLENCQIVDKNGTLTNKLEENCFSILWSAVNKEITKISMPLKLTSSDKSIYSGLLIDTLVIGGENMPILEKYSFQGYLTEGLSHGNIKHFIIREGVTQIGDGFCKKIHSYDDLKAVSACLPESIKKIGKYAFEDCSHLSEINLPNTIEQIERDALRGSAFLPDTLRLPQSLTKYYTTAFPVKNGQVVIIPESVTQIDNTYSTYDNTMNTWTTWDYIKTSNNYVWVMESKTPPFVTYEYERFLEGSTIYIPQGSYSAYSSKKPFSHAKLIEVIPIEEISFNKESQTLYVGEIINVKPLIMPSNASNKKLLWSTSNPDIATVDTEGNIQALKFGQTTISVTTIDGLKTASFILYVYEHVTSVKLPSCLSVNISEKKTLVPEITPIGKTDGKVSWLSSDPDIATVDENGIVKGVSKGTSTITIISFDGNFSAACNVSVIQPVESITLSPKTLSINVGDCRQIEATVLPTNANDKSIIWSSSNETIANVNSAGLISGVNPGNVRITATSNFNNEVNDVCEVTIIQPVAGISLDKSDVEILEDESLQLVAEVVPLNASNKKINWTSSDVSVAVVSSDGTVYAIKPGQATIMATTVDGGFIALCKVIVKAKEIKATEIRLSHSCETMAIGETLQLGAVLEPENVTNRNLSWTSTNPNVATVNPTGLIHALAQGTTQIIATTTDGSNLSAICEITVEKQFIEITQIQISPSSARISVGKSVKLNAIITPGDATSTNVLWSSTNTSVATVSQDGNVEAIAEGEAVIIASIQDGSNLSATCNISVYNDIILISEIILDPVNIEGDENESATINAVIIPENATNKQLKWYSSNDNVAVVNDGVVKLVKRGIAIITAEALDGSNVKSECTVVVSDSAGIESIIEDKNTDVKIFNLSGHLIYQGIYAEANIEPGIYIVLCKGRSFKAKID